MAIQNFSNGDLEDLYHSGRSARIQPPAARRKLLSLLDLLEYATDLGDFQRVSHFHALRGNRRGSYAFHVTANWRLTFRFRDGDAYDLDHEDDH